MRLSVNLLAKAPQAGLVKTRLIPLLGVTGAAWAQARLLEHMFGVVGVWQESHGNHLARVWLDVPWHHPFFRWRLEQEQWRRQPEVFLGERLIHVCRQGLAEADGVILLGGDGVSLTPNHLAMACEILQQAEAVMIPAEDGGYVLLGVRRLDESLFRDIPWGGDQVAEVTRQRLQSLGYSWQELPPLWDVDRPADWQRFCQSTGISLPTLTGKHVLSCQETFFGPLWLVANDGGLARLSWFPMVETPFPPDCLYQSCQWLSDYCVGKLSSLTVPLSLHGTSFQQKIWHHLTTIPPGTTLTYGQVADQTGSGPRAVGRAVGSNPLPIFLPCHRVVGVNGLVGYSGWGGIHSKKMLLQAEKVFTS